MVKLKQLRVIWDVRFSTSSAQKLKFKLINKDIVNHFLFIKLARQNKYDVVLSAVWAF